MLRFLILRLFADFLNSMPNEVKNPTFYQIFQFLTLFGM